MKQCFPLLMVVSSNMHFMHLFVQKCISHAFYVLLYAVQMAEAEENHKKEINPTAETVEVSCKADLNLETHCFLRLNGIPNSRCNPSVNKNGGQIKAVIFDTKKGNCLKTTSDRNYIVSVYFFSCIIIINIDIIVITLQERVDERKGQGESLFLVSSFCFCAFSAPRAHLHLVGLLGFVF